MVTENWFSFVTSVESVEPGSDSGSATCETSPSDASNGIVLTEAPTVADITAVEDDFYENRNAQMREEYNRYLIQQETSYNGRQFERERHGPICKDDTEYRQSMSLVLVRSMMQHLESRQSLVPGLLRLYSAVLGGYFHNMALRA
uniref:Uncharacterized protein n=1 Tax=Timema monikensis TaxID=170555 RepID=A0A7R9DXV8_9NEOP|nr:unnamed protein product [Timema monikensis]